MQRSLFTKDKEFRQLTADVKACTKCARMLNSERVFGPSCGTPEAKIMFIGEAPGRLGADSSSIPFHGDQAGHNFETLLGQVDISRYDSFITNAVLCNPKDDAGNNSTPTKSEIDNCAGFLKRQIDLVQPNIVVTLGATALKAITLIEHHNLTLVDSVRTSNRWYGRALIAAYHPGQRAMMHRSFANQLADYQFIAEELRRNGFRTPKPSSEILSQKTIAVIEQITSFCQRLSYFALHKLYYLTEVQAIKQLGHRISNSYIVRQKDGPYCVDLHISKLKKALPDLSIARNCSKIVLLRESPTLFTDGTRRSQLSEEEKNVVATVVKQYGALSDTELKRRTYLTKEMRNILRLERSQKTNMFNTSLLG